MNPAVIQSDIREFLVHFPLQELLRGKNFFITGATGHIVTILIHCLCALQDKYALGGKVYIQARDKLKANSLEALSDSIHVVLTDLESLRTLTVDRPIHYVIHLASPTTSRFMVEKPIETIDTIVNGTKAALEFSFQNHAEQFLYVSSMEVYGMVLQEVELTEDISGTINPRNPRSSYPMAKRMAECLSLCFAEEYGLPVKIARLSQTFGAGIDEADQRVYAQFARAIIANQDIILRTDGKQSQCFCYTTDTVSALLYILLKGEDHRIYNVGNSTTFTSIRALAERLCSVFGSGSGVRIEKDEHGIYPPTSYLKLNTDALRSLGWSPQVGTDEMFRRLIDYLR